MKKEMRDIFRNITLVGQLGLSIIMPLLICVLICAYLCWKFNIGGWIYIIGFILGIGSSFMTAYKFYLSEVKRASDDEKKKKPKAGYNRHS